MKPGLIDWGAIAKVWSVFEATGLAPSTMRGIESDLVSPLLLIGGGAGLNVEYLLARGFEVTAIDSCAEMVALAERRRGVNVLLHRGEELPFSSGAFASVLVSTGVVTRSSLYDGGVASIIRESLRVLRPNGCLAVAYCREDCRQVYVFERLGLNRVPSKAALFVDAESLEQARAAFLAAPDLDPGVVDHIFSFYPGLMEWQRSLIRKVVVELRRVGIDPRSFIEQELGYDYDGLCSEDEHYLHYLLGRRVRVEKTVALADEGAVALGLKGGG